MARKPFREQTEICDRHSKFEAKQVWQSSGYPQIDGNNLENRIVAHYPRLEKIILREEMSEFEDLFDELRRGLHARKRH